MKKTYKNRVNIIKISLVVLMGIIVFYIFKGGNISTRYESYVVSQGDTVYKIANEYEGQNTRKLIYEIQKINGIKKSMIKPNQVLIIPLETEI